ncbi:Zn(II)2Cys6 transcription factor [Aspergillus sclerotioniger CBS 115572]|uniref:Zn(II)2Cys6 transcription factor n=1 Tax=Aspergillus sclerotioniger CBS 115572 TaxID=1450535 RepID=A0A317X7V3_9EURO|nr:Zn(II)2Cys6 transcription factor [Aspergillus sclerotioniger CBS 115572]PWY94281.1 Zn(II)2Cys6 transcription factor [Aspergillus sclerotioniger CBS 115572]
MEAPRARGMGRSGPRRRTGCLTCRARKVRCDETKPTCANCTRLRLQCAYKPTSPGVVSRHTSHNVSTTTAPGHTTIAARPDVNFFHTVLCNDRISASASGSPQQAGPGRPLHSLSTDIPSFDILSFIGEITSDFQQKHLDLTTNGLAGFPAGSVPAAIANEELDQNERPIGWGSASAQVIQADTSDQGSSDTSGSRVTYEDQLFAHFVESDPPPTVFGPVTLEWEYVRANIVGQSRESREVLHGVYCYAEIHEASIQGKAWKLASKYHQLACSEVQSCLLGEVGEAMLKRVFTTVLLLMLSELLSTPDLWGSGTSFLHSAYLLLQRFQHRTKLWTGVNQVIVSWVSLLDVKALIAGRDGDPLIEMGCLSKPNITEMSTEDRPADHSSDDEPPRPAYLIREAITGPAFRFFLQTQQVIRRIVCIDLHHRSRGTVSDEFEVLQIAHQVGADLETLWNWRPRVLDVYSTPEDLFDTLQPAIAFEVCRTFRQYIANFLAIFIYLHRVAFAIYPRTDRVHRAVDRIIQLATAEVESSGSDQQHLPASFVWPLFVAGLEGSIQQRRWIVKEMQRITGTFSSRCQDPERVPGTSRTARHPHAGKALLLLEEMTRRQDASRTWADSRCVRRELFTDFFVMI